MNVKQLIQKNLETVYLLLLSLLCVGLYYYCFSPKIFLGGDNVYYYNLGKALAEGHGYVTLNSPGMPPASHYPPGYPAIIAIAMVLISKSIITIKIVNGALLLGSVLGSFLLFKKLSANIHAAFVGAVLVVMNPSILEYGSIMMSEIPFLFFSILSLLLFTKTEVQKSPFRQPYFYFFVLSLSMAYHIKSIGIALIGGFALYFLFHKKWRWLISTVGGFTILGLPWFIRDQMLGGSSYLKQLMMVNPYRPELGQAGFSDLALRFLENLQRYVAIEIPFGLFPFLRDTIPSYSVGGWVFGILLCLVIIYGIYRLKNYSLLIGSYLLSIFGILMLWPEVWFGVRFILPILPLLIFCLLIGFFSLMQTILSEMGYGKYWHPLYLLAIGTFFISSLQGLHINAQSPHPKNWAIYISMAEWAKENTPQDAVISCRKPAIFNLFSERKTFRFKDTPDNEELMRDLKNHGTDYVVLDRLGFSSTPRYLFPALKKYSHQFKTVLKGNEIQTYLLKFEPDSVSNE